MCAQQLPIGLSGSWYNKKDWRIWSVSCFSWGFLNVFRKRKFQAIYVYGTNFWFSNFTLQEKKQRAAEGKNTENVSEVTEERVITLRPLNMEDFKVAKNQVKQAKHLRPFFCKIILHNIHQYPAYHWYEFHETLIVKSCIDEVWEKCMNRYTVSLEDLKWRSVK